MALTSGRATPQRADNKEYRFPVANAAVIYPGALVMLNASGEANPERSLPGEQRPAGQRPALPMTQAL